MTSYQSSFKDLLIPYFREVFEKLNEVFSEMHVPFYMIGVNAIDLQLLQEGHKPARGTKDIDFAIMISSVSRYNEIVKRLYLEGFNKVKAPWTLYHPEYNVTLDLLPFGEIEEHDTVNFNERNIDLHVLGFREVLDEAITLRIEDREIRLPDLPGVVVLKLVAWSDRPEERQNDLVDILRVISHAYEIYEQEILEIHHDIFLGEKEFDRLKIGARTLGRKSKRVLDKSEKLMNRIMQVLDQNTDANSRAPLAEYWARMRKWEVVYAQELLKEFKKGVSEGV